MVRKYRELHAWQVGFSLARLIYAITALFPKAKTFGLTAQIQRAAVSIPGNLAEGTRRASDEKFAHIARGSLNEMETPLLLAQEFGYCQLTADLLNEIERLHALLNGLRNPLNT